MWDKFKSIGTKIAQIVINSILKALLNYPRINKPKGYDKLVIQIFAEVRYLFKRFRTAMTSGRDLWYTRAIVIALDTLYDNFDRTTACLLESGDKTIDQINSILQSKEAKNISKRTTGAVRDLAMAFLDRKIKANSDEEWYNCHQLGHLATWPRLSFLRQKTKQDSTPEEKKRSKKTKRFAGIQPISSSCKQSRRLWLWAFYIWTRRNCVHG